jgi:hypothetical protein
MKVGAGANAEVLASEHATKRAVSENFMPGLGLAGGL